MQYKTLGNTGLLISQVCLGTMTFGSGKGIFKPIAGINEDEAAALVRRSIDI